jgi:hypothetical protein
MAADKTIKAIIATAEKAIAEFQKRIPGIQSGLVDSILTDLKELSTKDGVVLNSVQNLKLIAALKTKLEKLIISEGYKDDVKKFVEAFNTVEGLQKQYFAAFNLKFSPSKVLPIIKNQAIDSTVNGLLGQGLQANIVERIGKILIDNVTTGGTYASLSEQLRNHILTNETGEGSLERYTKTITTDAINQYSAQYHEALAADLEFNWGRYVGSNITTTREFCERLTAKEWVHKSELPKIVKGEIGGQQCKLSKSTGLPLGMIPGSDENNFKIRRGGYNCGHQFFWVPDSAVPDQVKRQFVSPQPLNKSKVDMKVLKAGNLGDYLDSQAVQKKLKPLAPELSKEEKTAIFGYSDNEYFALNRYLRGVANPKNPEYQENYKNLLSNALSASNDKFQGWVFRGIRAAAADIQKYYDSHQSGKPVTHVEFTSTSYTIGSEFGGNVKFSIYSKRGVKIENLSMHGAAEKEVLFNTGTQFKVISIREDSGITYIKMEEI